MTHHQGQSTGASNLEYDLVTVLHNLLEGNEALEKYMEDVRGAGDQQVEDLFRRLHDQNRQNVTEVRSILARYLQGGQAGQSGGQSSSGGQSHSSSGGMSGGQMGGGQSSGHGSGGHSSGHGSS